MLNEIYMKQGFVIVEIDVKQIIWLKFLEYLLAKKEAGINNGFMRMPKIA